jgi:hypothetical protein
MPWTLVKLSIELKQPYHATTLLCSNKAVLGLE